METFRLGDNPNTSLAGESSAIAAQTVQIIPSPPTAGVVCDPPEAPVAGRRLSSPNFARQGTLYSRLMATRSSDVMELSRTIQNHWDPDVSFEL